MPAIISHHQPAQARPLGIVAIQKYRTNPFFTLNAKKLSLLRIQKRTRWNPLRPRRNRPCSPPQSASVLGCAARYHVSVPVRLRFLLPILAFAALPARPQTAAEIQGTVVDARGGEALANVVVELAGAPYRATTDPAGRFHITGVAPGDYTVNVSTVGYRLVKKAFHLDAGETKDFEVVLSPGTFHQTETVVARADPFETTRQDAPSTLVLAGTDAKNLGSVLADDPLRAVQGLPGVSSNNDFDARFSLRGADYSRVGLYIDGVLLHSPFHMLEGTTVSGSGTAFNADIVEEMELYESAFPGALRRPQRGRAGRNHPRRQPLGLTPSGWKPACPTPDSWPKGRSGRRRKARGWSPRARATCSTFWSAPFRTTPWSSAWRTCRRGWRTI